MTTSLRGVQKLITRLNPRPGAGFSNDEARYIVPDVIVRKIKGMWAVSLNPDAMPKLRINRMYADILSAQPRCEPPATLRPVAGSEMADQECAATLRHHPPRVAGIVDRQRHFFEHGEVAMRPLVLREIAETLGLHESTVSRVTTQKFMFTPRGIFELKYFFGSHVTTETGGACSATAIRALIKQLVGGEDTQGRCRTARSRTSWASRASWLRGEPSQSTGNLCRSCRSTCANPSERLKLHECDRQEPPAPRFRSIPERCPRVVRTAPPVAMSLIAPLLPASRVIADLDVASKKRVFEHIGQLYEDTIGLPRAVVYDSLFARERLGSTGLGHAVAVPHGRVKGLKEAAAAFVRTRQPIPFEAPDGHPVNLIFVLLVPEKATDLHLQILSEAGGDVQRPGPAPPTRRNSRCRRPPEHHYPLGAPCPKSASRGCLRTIGQS